MAFRPSHPLTLAAALVATALLAPTSRAEITPAAKKAVDRYIEATGGLDALQSIRSLRIKASLSAFSLTGTTTSYAVRPDKHASETLLGPFKILEGFDGKTGWRVDQSGKLVMLDGKDLEDARAGGTFETELWMLPDQGGCKV